MTTFKIYIGVDISKNWLDFAILKQSSDKYICHRVDNTAKALKNLQKELRKQHILFNKNTLVVMEHTGIYKRPLLDFLITKHSSICVEVALRIKKSLGIQRGKNDKIDAKRIAKYARDKSTELRIWKNPRKSLLILKDLLSTRDRMLKVRSALQVPLKEMSRFYSKEEFGFMRSTNEDAVEGVSNSLTKIEFAIKRLVKNDEAMSHKVKLITSVRGIGPVTACQLICDTHDFTLFERASQLACYCGVAPFKYSSGKSVAGKARVHHFANKKLKSLLHIAAIAAIRGRNELKDYYDRKVSEGKSRMSVINAVRNKLLKRVVAVVRRDSPYVDANRTTYLEKKQEVGFEMLSIVSQ